MAKIAHPIDGVTYASEELAQRYLASSAWIDLTVGQALRITAASSPDAHAFIMPERSITFAELDESVDRLGAALLDLGVASGQRAIFQMGTAIETVIALLACYRTGIIPVCAVPQYREVEIGQLLAQSQASAYFVQADVGTFDLLGFACAMRDQHSSLRHVIVARAGDKPLPDAVRPLEKLIDDTPAAYARERVTVNPPLPQDVLSFQLSGGTTGVPKIIPRFHAEYLGHAAAWMRQFGIEQDSKLIWPLPLMHNAGQLYALIPPVLGGSTTVLMAKVDIPQLLGMVERHRVTHGLSIGPIAPQLLAYQDIANHDLSSLKVFGTMSRADIVEAHVGVPCLNFYGITEGILLGSAPDSPAAVRHQTQGCSGCPQDEFRLLVPETEQAVRPGEMGEFCFRGPSSLRGYYGNAEASRAALTSDGFFRSGDMMTECQLDGRNYFRFEGRLRDNINRGGEKIACEEVEGFLSRHPAIADAKLVAMPDPIYGEKACAFLIMRPGHSVPTIANLIAFVTAHGLAKYKCPERIEVLDTFPTTKVGKLNKPALREMIEEKLKSESRAARGAAS
jgi:non-ribosomal peptide synthetase component E (peptide arylation enzyme)